MGMSKLHVYSLGVVASNKLLSSFDIEVTPIEDNAMSNGEITDNVSDYTAKAKDADSAAYEVTVPTTATIKATWLPMGSSNRITAPDVRRGETVVIWRFADADKYYWATLKDDMHLRKLETVVYAFSATKIEGDKTDADNSYFLEVSTHKKLIHLHTTRSNGEPFSYDIQLNTDDGFFTIQDDAGNSIQMDSAGRRLFMFNKDGSFVDINKKQISINAADQIKMTSKSIVLESSTYTQTATTNTITAQTTHIGNIALSGGMATSPGPGGPGNITLQGGMVASNDVVAGGISLKNHDHQEGVGRPT